MLGFARAVLLARFLMPEHFGVVALALFFIGLCASLRYLGLDDAFIHRQEPGEQFAATYFTLRIGLDLTVAMAVVVAAPVVQAAFPQMGGLGAVLPALACAYVLSNLSCVQETMLRKHLSFAALAKTDVLASVVMTVVAPYLAWRGYGIWALAAEHVSGAATRALLTWGPLRHWQPRLGWNRDALGELWAYGRSSWLGSNLLYVLDRLDDFWVGFALGKTPLGFYSKSYELAHYPRRVFANPVIAVFSPILARLQGDRDQLSRAFSRAAHAVIRIGCLAAGMFGSVMPEFIDLVIGEKWRPMLWTFRIMVIYAAIDPLMILVSSVFLVTGCPHELTRIRVIQAFVFIPAMVAGAALWGINGVAVAADVMLIVGAWTALRPLSSLMDFSVARLALWPAIAFTIAASAAAGVEWQWQVTSIQSALVKLLLFGTVFAGLLLCVEGRDYVEASRSAARALWKPPDS